jgi:large subunit ribosomal protein L14e
MVAIEVGRVCKKLQGREAGRFCVVVDLIDESYVEVTGPRDLTDVRRRKCNILHLEPTDDKLDIKKGASDKDVEKALEKAKLTDKVKSKLDKDRPRTPPKPKKK